MKKDLPWGKEEEPNQGELTPEEVIQRLDEYVCGFLKKITFESTSLVDQLAQIVRFINNWEAFRVYFAACYRLDDRKKHPDAEKAALALANSTCFAEKQIRGSRVTAQPLADCFTKETLPDDFPARKEYLSFYFHDAGNAIIAVSSVAEKVISILREEQDMGKNIQLFMSYVQEDLTTLLHLQEGFSLSSGEIRASPTTLSSVAAYTESQVTKLNTRHTTGKTHLVGRFKIIHESGADESRESNLSIPALLRVFINAVQNAERAYAPNSKKGKASQALINVSMKITADSIFLVIDDYASGFPQDESENAVLNRSAFDNTQMILYTPSPGKTKWANSTRGTGTGLYGLTTSMRKLGGTLHAGTRIDEQGKLCGGRLEIVMPLLKSKK